MPNVFLLVYHFRVNWSDPVTSDPVTLTLSQNLTMTDRVMESVDIDTTSA